MANQPHSIPPLTAVKSSSAEAAGHDGQALFVRFKNGKTYRYPSVTRDDYARLMGADSFGKHLQGHIVAKHKGDLVEQPKGGAQ